MNGELKPIKLQDLGEVLSEYTPMLAQASTLLLEGTFNGQRLCLLGFISATFLSDRAYLWMDTYPAAADHKVCVGRWARRFIPEALKRWPTIIGHCGPSSVLWLRSLGAIIIDGEFELRAPQ